MTIKRRATLAAAAAVLALGGVFAAGVPAYATSGYGYDGTYPGACATGSYPAASYPILTSSGASVGTMEVRYSPSCGTNWVRAYSSLSGYVTDKQIYRSSPSYTTAPEYDATPGWSYSPQVYAPGATCVVATVYMYPAGGGPFYASAVQAVCG